MILLMSTYYPTYEENARKCAYLLVFFTYEEMCVHARRCARTRDHGFEDGHKSNKSNKYEDLRAKAAPSLVVSGVSAERPPPPGGSYQSTLANGYADSLNFASGCIFQTVSTPGIHHEQTTLPKRHRQDDEPADVIGQHDQDAQGGLPHGLGRVGRGLAQGAPERGLVQAAPGA